MDERNKDLPLIVSEILIEMHEMKEAINRLSSIVVKQQEHVNSMFNVVLDENKKNMAFMVSMMAEAKQETAALIQEVRQETATVKRETATLIQEMRQESATLVEKNRQQAQEDRDFLAYSFNKTMGQQQQINAAFEQRLSQLEAKYNG